jgi:hypothetical protein
MPHLAVIVSLLVIAAGGFLCARVKAPFNVLVLAASIGVSFVGCVSAPKLWQLYWESRLAKELPSGSTLGRADSFFKAAHVEYSYDLRSHTLYAIERDVSELLIVSYGIQIRCRFTAADVLVSCTAEVYGDGP